MTINLSKVWKLNNNQYPLLGTANSLAEFPFMAEYVANHNSFDRNFMLKYGYMLPIWNVDDAESENGVVIQFRSDATDVIRKHKVDLQHLWDITQLEYNPIENYNREEATENAKSGADTQSNVYGAYSETMSKGEQNDEDSFGARNVTNTQGAQNNSETFGERNVTNVQGAQSNSTNFGATKATTVQGEQSNTTSFGAKNVTNVQGAQSNSTNFGEIVNTSGAQNNSTTNQVSAFNSASFEDNQKTAEAIGEKIDRTGAHADSQSIGARTDSVSEQARTDSQEIGQRTDTVSEQARTDSQEIGQRTDTVSEGSRTDSQSIGSRTDSVSEEARVDSHKSGARTDEVEHSQKDDTLTTSYDSKNKIVSTIRGNVGVTTTQQMAQSEIDLWSGFNFYNKLFDIIIEELCYFADDGDAPLLTPLQNSMF